MPENTTLSPGAGGDTIAADDVAGVKYQQVKLIDGTADSTAVIPGDAANGLDVDVTRVGGNVTVVDGGGSLTVDNPTISVVGGGAEATAQRVTIASDSTGVLSVDDNGGNLSIDDGGNSITVDNAVISVVGGGTEAAAQRVTIASDSTGVLSVDDNGGNLSIDDGGNSITVDNGGTFAVQDSEKVADNGGFTDGTTKVLPAGFIFDEVAGTALTENDVAAARIDSKRAQAFVIEDETTRGRRTTVTAANALKVDASGVAVPITDNAGSLTVDNAQLSVVGSGTEAAAMRVTIATDSTGVLSVDDNGGSLTVDNATISVVGSGTEATAQRVTIATDSTGVLSVDDNGGSLTVDGAVSTAPRTTGGLSIGRDISLDETETEIKATAGQVYGWYFFNAATTTRYVKFYNATAANVTVGSTTPVMTVPIPAGSAANVEYTNGIAFSTAICVACTTGVSDADATAPTANDLVGNVLYA